MFKKLALMAAICGGMATAASAGITVEHMMGDNDSPSNNIIKPFVRLTNSGTATVDLKNCKVNYMFYEAGIQASNLEGDAYMPNNLFSVEFEELTTELSAGSKKANVKAILVINESQKLEPGQSIELHFGVQTTCGQSTFNENDDWSNTGSTADFVPTNNIEVIDGSGKRLAGKDGVKLSETSGAYIKWMGQLASAPKDAANGDAYFNIAEKKAYVNYLGSWQELSSVTGSTQVVTDESVEGSGAGGSLLQKKSQFGWIYPSLAGDNDNFGYIIIQANDDVDGTPLIAFADADGSAFRFCSGFAVNGAENNHLTLKGRWTGDEALMTWTGDSRVGIGTSRPEAQLDVRGNVWIEAEDEPEITFKSTSTQNVMKLHYEEQSGDYNGIQFRNKDNIPVTVINENGKIYCTELEVVNAIDNVADYVFSDEYKLLSLREVEKFIDANNHLPNIKSEAEFKNDGKVSVGEFQMKLLEKIEELTLYTIQQEKKLTELEEKVNELKN